jgi:hypothetical protein
MTRIISKRLKQTRKPRAATLQDSTGVNMNLGKSELANQRKLDAKTRSSIRAKLL